MSLRRTVYKQLHQGAWEYEGLSPVNKLVAFLIFFSVFIVIVETEKPLFLEYKSVFRTIDYSLGVLFAVE